jgi:uncharacterized metal-binding protein YceD (DUF177 family)
VKRKNEYVIRFSELIDEEVSFEFSLEETFFLDFESSEWQGGNILATIVARKRTDGITLNFNLEGHLDVACDRCLGTFPLAVKSRETLFVKYGHEEGELDNDVVQVSRDDNQIDVSDFLYEYLVLSIPVKRIHPSDASGNTLCDPAVIAKLEKHLLSEEKNETDPRWDDLKKLLDKN